MVQPVNPDELFIDLKDKTSSYLTKSGTAMLKRAYTFAQTAHKSQKRKSGEAFITHPLQVAIILAELKMDSASLIAALLHDVVEDTKASVDEVKTAFTKEISVLVDGVTKITQLEVDSLNENQAVNLRKMLVAMSVDIRVIVIKLADRLHNMRTLDALPPERQKFKAQETRDIYAPLAHRLGVNSIRWELEDLSFYYLEPEKYKQIERMVSESREVREEYLGRTQKILQTKLKSLSIEGKITGRPKHLYSIYTKMTQKGRDFSDIYDLIALRIICESIAECWTILGAVHTIWKPIPGRFKDYISIPKFNMYRSLHTTVIGPDAKPLEIQIRTKDMHMLSEYGIAAHWRYKQKSPASAQSISDPTKGKTQSKKAVQDDFEATFAKQVAWLHNILELADDTSESRDFLEAFKTDVHYQEVFAFTPKGELVMIRKGSCIIDFAYAIHTEVGHHCVGGKVNGAIVPLSYTVKMGDRVEILTQNSTGPSYDWLKLVKTPSAKQKIRSYFTQQNKGSNIDKGKDLLTTAAKKLGHGISSRRAQAALTEIAKSLNLKDTNELLLSLSFGRFSADTIALKLSHKIEAVSSKKVPVIGSVLSAISGSNKKNAVRAAASLDAGASDQGSTKIDRGYNPLSSKPTSRSDVIVEGVNNPLVRFARCCNPLPGDVIIGFVTSGRGVSVHRKDCTNAKDLLSHSERIIKVNWQDNAKTAILHSTEIFVEARDRLRLLGDVTELLSKAGLNIIMANSQSTPDGFVSMLFTLEIADAKQLSTVIYDLQQINGVISVERAQSSKLQRQKRQKTQRKQTAKAHNKAD